MGVYNLKQSKLIAALRFWRGSHDRFGPAPVTLHSKWQVVCIYLSPPSSTTMYRDRLAASRVIYSVVI